LCDEKLYPGDVIVFIAGIGYMHEDCVPGDVNENRIEEIGSVYKKMPKESISEANEILEIAR